MQYLKTVQLCISVEENTKQFTLVDTRTIAVTQINTKNKDGEIPVYIVFLAPICFIVIGAIFLLLISTFVKVAQNKKSVSNIEDLKQSPCRDCIFFHDNSYMKCAVNPSVVLTKQAIDCSEYQPI